MTGIYLGIDIGTSAVKALLADEEQRVLAEATQELSISRPHPLWSEQDPEDWWSAVVTVVTALRRAAPDRFAAIRGVGLSGQMHGAVLLDSLERRALARAVRRTRAKGTAAGNHRRRAGDARFHRAEAALDRGA
jgi:xylulokinase